MFQKTLTWERFENLARTAGELAALGNLKPSGGIDWWSWSEAFETCSAVAGELLRKGVKRGERVGILGRNQREFWLFELAVLGAGGVPTPIYPTLPPSAIGWILQHSQIAIAAVGDWDAAKRLQAGAASVGWELSLTVNLAGDEIPGTVPWRELARAGPWPQLPVRDVADPALQIYTSGTTGTPKGVVLSERALWSVLEETQSLLEPVLRGDRFRVVSYLPLAHIAEQMMSILAPLAFAGQVGFAPRSEGLRDALLATRPTVFLGVPRVWEKLEEVLRQKFRSAPWPARFLFDWVQRPTGSSARRLGELRHLLLRQLYRRLGFDRLRFALSGAAALSPATFNFFASLDLPIHEVYGMTETAALMAATRPGQIRPGSCGQLLSIGELRLAPDGEILYRGPNLFTGYFRDPEATQAIFDDDGFLRTGDLGILDPSGFLTIIGRKKELLVTSGGKNVAPAEVEPLLEKLDGVAQAVLVGDGKPFLGALLTLRPEALERWTEAIGLSHETPEQACRDPRFRQWVLEQINLRVNPLLAGYQRIRAVAILPREFSIEAGELTPTLKLRREEIFRRYREEIEALFASPPLPSDSIG